MADWPLGLLTSHLTFSVTSFAPDHGLAVELGKWSPIYLRLSCCEAVRVPISTVMVSVRRRRCSICPLP